MGEEDDFFVGYLPVSPRVRRRMILVAIVGLALMAGLAASAAAFQRHPGRALEGSERGEFRGRFTQSPYPHLRYLDEGGEEHAALIVRGHKAGLGETFSHLDGESVVLSGQLFHRAGASLLVAFRSPERSDGDDLPDDPSPPSWADTVELQGEIVDSKCYFGQMRPGDGQGHRACAQLCVRGGIPPVLVARGEDGQEQPYVLVGEAARGEAVLPFLAEAVTVRGRIGRAGALQLLELESVRRHRGP